MQQDLIDVLWRRVKSMCRRLRPGNSCGASLERLLGNLGNLEAELSALDLIPYSRVRVKPQMKGGVLEHGPQPRGVPTGRPGPLVADRVDFPETLRDFQAQPFLSHRSYLCLVSPDQFLKDEDDVEEPMPVGRLASPEELFRLAARWDRVHRVVLFKEDEVNPLDVADCFPVLKEGEAFPGEGIDRQILDRRRRNAREERVVSGSKMMPHSVMVSEIFLGEGEGLLASLDDLRNFYHMITGSKERGRSTPVGPSFEARLFRGWNAWESRFEDGDRVHVCWPGLGMGDLNAVDLAEEMHVGVLRSTGGMQECHTLIYPKPLPYNVDGFYEGVMIDDHVGLQIVKLEPSAKEDGGIGTIGEQVLAGEASSLGGGSADCAGRSFMDEVFDTASATYEQVGLEAHVKKRKRNEATVEFWGGELEGREGLHGAPRRKIAMLGVLCLELARIGFCSIRTLEQMCGLLAYVLVFRRPLMSILFHVYRQCSPDGSRETPIQLHAWARNELMTIGLLLPMALAYLRVPADDRLYAADASLLAAGGAVVKVGVGVVRELWRRISLKVRHLGLLDPVTASLRVAGWDVDAEMFDEVLPDVAADDREVLDSFVVNSGIDRPAADDDFDKRALIDAERPHASLGICCFAVLEVCGGCGGITKWCSRYGLPVGPVIELKRGWNMFEDGMFHWFFRLALAGRIWLLMLEPPCTTFSIARSPKLRSSSEAEGFEPIEYETLQGNLFFMMCTLLALAQYAAGNDCLFEQPATGFSKFSCFWLLLLGAGFDSLVTPFCGYLPKDGIVYKKDSVFAHIGTYWKSIIKPCTCVVPHTRLEGSLTTQASAYPDALCRQIGRIAKEHFPGGEGPWGHLYGAGESGNHGRENSHAVGGGPRRRIRGSDLFGVILSECLPWSVILKHPFKKHGHINIQEARAYKSLLRRVPSSRRFVVAQDSQVNLAVEAKGRSSSIALNRVVSQTAVETIGREQYPKAYHTPTWSLRADAPSRNRQIERPRCCWPPWLWDLADGSPSRTASAVAALDALPEVSKAELRWVHWTLSLASSLDLLLGVGRGSTAASAGWRKD